MNELQDRVTAFMTNIAEEDYNEIAKELKFKPDVSDGTPTEFLENLKKIIVPKGMNKLQAVFNLIKQHKEEEKPRNYKRTFPNFFMNDFLIAIGVMVPKYFGMLHISKINTDGVPTSPDYIQFPVKYDNGRLKTEKGFVGSILAPVWEDAIIDIHPTGTLVIRAKMKFEKEVNDFLGEVEDYLKKTSVIRGAAVKILEVRGGLMAEPINPKENMSIVLSESNERLVKN